MLEGIKKFGVAPTIEIEKNQTDEVRTIEELATILEFICENFNITNTERGELEKALTESIKLGNPVRFEQAVESYAHQEGSSSETIEKLDILVVFVRRLLNGPSISAEESPEEEASWRSFWRRNQPCSDGTIRVQEQTNN